MIACYSLVQAGTAVFCSVIRTVVCTTRRYHRRVNIIFRRKLKLFIYYKLTNHIAAYNFLPIIWRPSKTGNGVTAHSSISSLKIFMPMIDTDRPTNAFLKHNLMQVRNDVFMITTGLTGTLDDISSTI